MLEKCMKVVFNFELPYKIITVIFTSIFLFTFVSGFRLLFYGEMNVSYRSYYNVNVDVFDYGVSGKVNNMLHLSLSMINVIFYIVDFLRWKILLI